jgi:enoyl-CoA hydratase/carnithine racemase
MNSLSDQLLADFRAAMDKCEADESVRAMIVTGSGKAFQRRLRHCAARETAHDGAGLA